MGGKAKAPKAPDLVAADAAQYARNKEAATDVMNTNRYDQASPYGSNTWTTDPVTGKTTNTTSLSPQEQALYSGQNSLAQQMTGNAGGALGAFMQQYFPGVGGGAAGGGGTAPAGGGGGMLPSFGASTAGSSAHSAAQGVPGGIYGTDKKSGVGGVGTGIQGDLDYSKLTAMPTTDPAQARQQAQDALYKMNTQYLDPQMQEAQRSLEAKLTNQGLVPGTPAYNRAAQIQNDASQKAYESARQGAIAGGGAEAERAQQMALALRNQGVTEAGNLGAFHNAAQGQRAGQLLTDVGQQRGLEGTKYGADAAANASMQNASMANQLGQRNAAFNEAMQMAQFGQGSEHSPTFQTSQGNMSPYGTGNIVNANQTQYQDQVAAAQAKNSSGLGGMVPGLLGMAGTYFGGPLGGMAANALGSKLFGSGGGAGAWTGANTQGGGQ